MALFMSLPQRGKRTSHWASPSVLDLRYLLCPERAKLLCYVDWPSLFPPKLAETYCLPATMNVGLLPDRTGVITVGQGTSLA